jgi:ubiquinone/menaquinone biosynthesis C-methylase UbiE
MKMRRVEKRFVNSLSHSRRVADQAIARVARVMPTSGQRLLEVGCGNGAAAIELAKTMGLEVVGVDVDPEQVAAAGKTAAAAGAAGVRFLVADASRLPLADDEFDLVYTNKTTHHVPDWQRAVAEMGRVLKPGGHLLYSDFVAPFGRRLPTRRGVNAAATAAGLLPQARTSAPLHYTAVFAKADCSRPEAP